MAYHFIGKLKNSGIYIFYSYTVLRPEFKFPGKIEMAFSQMLAIRSWLQFWQKIWIQVIVILSQLYDSIKIYEKKMLWLDFDSAQLRKADNIWAKPPDNAIYLFILRPLW